MDARFQTDQKCEPEVERTTEEQVQIPAQEVVLSADALTALQGKAQECEELQQRLLRLQADFDNYRRRTQREKEDLAEYASQKLITSILPIIDNFERALAVQATGVESKGILQGVQMIQRQMMELLQREGLAEMNAQGQPFDPNFHEAVMQVPAEGVEDNTVIDVLQKGYCLKERVIRPAMVKVARK